MRCQRRRLFFYCIDDPTTVEAHQKPTSLSFSSQIEPKTGEDEYTKAQTLARVPELHLVHLPIATVPSYVDILKEGGWSLVGPLSSE